MFFVLFAGIFEHKLPIGNKKFISFCYPIISNSIVYTELVKFIKENYLIKVSIL